MNAPGRPHEVRLIGGRWKRSKLPVADRPGLRPTPSRVRETLFNWLGQDLSGWRVLDAFAGSGALGFEAASLWVRNDAARSVYLNLGSTGAASTSAVSLEIKSSESWGPFAVPKLSGFSAISTEAAPFRVVASGW